MNVISPGIGHNAAPVSTTDHLNVDVVTEQWRLDHHALLTKGDQLRAGAKRLMALYGSTLPETEEDGGKVGDFIKQLKDTAKAAGNVHSSVKAPYLAIGNAADAMFKRGVQDDLLQVAKTVADKVYVPFLAKQEEIRRRKAREEAERRALELEKARLEAERLAREAEEQRRAAEQARIDAEAKRLEAERLAAPVAQHEPEVATQMIASVAIAQEEAALGEEIAAATSHDLAVAQNAADEAAAQVAAAKRAQELAARTATGSTTDLSRTRGAGGSVASLKTTWEFEVLDLSKVPLKYLTINEAMIRADIRGEQGEREIPGLRIYPVQSARVR